MPDFTLGPTPQKIATLDRFIQEVAATMTQRSVAPAVPAATILLLRGDHAALEVFMVVRHHQIDFASGALVFPGGKVDPQDEDRGPRGAMRRRLRRAGDARDPDRRNPRGLRRVRRTARPRGRRIETDRRQLGSPTLEPFRDQINKGEVGFQAFLDQQDLRLACDQLVPFAHWITPEMMPKRFDTHFFIADAPPDQVALHDGHESVDSVWITPKDALAGAASRRYTVIFPTLRQVEKLGHAVSPADAIARARAAGS